MDQLYDIAIVGGGLAGSALAKSMAEKCFRVIVGQRRGALDTRRLALLKKGPSMSKRNREKQTRRSFATREEAIVSAFDDPAIAHLDVGGALTVLMHEGTLKMIDGVARANGMTRGGILVCILMGEDVKPSRPVYVLSVHAEDPRALARDHPITIGSDDPRNPPVAFIATQDPTPAEREAIGQQRVMVRLGGHGSSSPADA